MPPRAPSERPTGWSHAALTSGTDGTRELAAALAGACRPGDVVLLIGDLGTGKTTFAQGFARGLGVAGPVTSPTFTLVRQYPVPGDRPVRQLVHADVYRLDSLAEVADLALLELAEDGAVVLVEWGDRAAPVLGDSALSVTLGAPAPTFDPTQHRPGGGDGPAEAAGAGCGGPDGGTPGDEQRRVVVGGRGPRWAGRGGEIGAILADGRHPGRPGHGGVTP